MPQLLIRLLPFLQISAMTLRQNGQQLNALNQPPEQRAIGAVGAQQKGGVVVQSAEDVLLEHHVAEPTFQRVQTKMQNVNKMSEFHFLKEIN